MWPGTGITSDATCPSAYQFWIIRLLQISALMLWAIHINRVMPLGFQPSYHYDLASIALDFNNTVLVFASNDDMSAVWTMPFEWSPFLSICHADESPLKKWSPSHYWVARYWELSCWSVNTGTVFGLKPEMVNTFTTCWQCSHSIQPCVSSKNNRRLSVLQIGQRTS